MTRRTVCSCVGLAVLTLLISGCGGILAGETGDPALPRARFIGADPRILVHVMPIEMQASISGELEYSSAGKCLVIKNRYGAGVHGVLVWSDGVEPAVKDGKKGVRLADGSLLLEGDHFMASGGSVQPNAKEFAHLDMSNWCLQGSGSLIVLNSDVRHTKRT
ncbi:hypothetical protein [Streptosporangium sp. KLBMP 9127]|nr:hypothetical protein [Streptosporangium sp. KLBMP 9127]